MSVISTADAMELFDLKGLWSHAFDVLTWHLQQYFQRENMLSHKKTPLIVIEHLKHIWEMPYEVRDKVSVYKFILSRAHLSRSSVHKILKELSESGSITISRGKLIFLDGNMLPTY